MTEIVKVQLPIVGGGQALIYDRARKHIAQRLLLPHEKKKMGDDYKAFFKGSWSSIVGWGLSGRVPDEEW